MAEPAIAKEFIQLETRVPEGYSASARDHDWHLKPGRGPAEVTGMTAGKVFDLAEAMMAGVPDRDDEDHRVVFVTQTVTRRVLAP